MTHVNRTATTAVTPGRRAPGAIHRSLLWRVMILVGVGMAAVIVAFGVASILAVDESRDRTLDERRALALVAARHVDYIVRHNLEALDQLALAESFDLQDGDLGPEQQALRRVY